MNDYFYYHEYCTYSLSLNPAEYNLPSPDTIIEGNRLDLDTLDKNVRTNLQVLRMTAFCISM